MSRPLWIPGLCLALLVACGAHPPPLTCTELFGTGAPATDEAMMEDVLEAARSRFYPNLAKADIALVADASQLYFASNLDYDTLEDAPLDRHYQVHYNPQIFADPPSRFALGAILVHELKHVTDYTQMSSATLAEFGIWYATGDVDDYEHQTDVASLEAGCATGLKAYRVWLYAHVPSADLAAKEAEYYTPDQIDAWIAANPTVK
jgi:hypothetical protein